MTVKEFDKKFKEIFVPYFKQYGFESFEKTRFRKKINDIMQIISFGPRVSKDGTGAICIGGGFGISIPEIDELINPEKIKDFTTVGMPLHLLRPEREYYLWGFKELKDIELGMSQMTYDIEKYGFSFFEKFSSSEKIFQEIKYGAPIKSFVISNDKCDAILVAFTFIREGKQEAFSLGKNLLEKYKDKMPKYSKKLQEVLEEISKR